MTTPIMYQSERILNAHEGIVNGIITCLRYQDPDITDKDIISEINDILSDWNTDELGYWYDWFGLE